MSKGDLQFCSFIVKFSSSGDKNPIQSRHSDGSSEQDLKKYLIGKVERECKTEGKTKETVRQTKTLRKKNQEPSRYQNIIKTTIIKSLLMT